MSGLHEQSLLPDLARHEGTLSEFWRKRSNGGKT